MIAGVLLFLPRLLITAIAAVVVVALWPVLWWLDPRGK